jgi:hypothetical protein
VSASEADEPTAKTAAPIAHTKGVGDAHIEGPCAGLKTQSVLQEFATDRNDFQSCERSGKKKGGAVCRD